MRYSMLINRITQTLVTPPVPPIICVFVGSLDEVDSVVTELVPNLPLVFSTTIDVQHIGNSTTYLQASRHCRVFYTESCFKVITPEEFINTHYDWLYKQVNKWYYRFDDANVHISDVDDTFQEMFLYLERILSKYENQCNLRTFVANRLRRYFDLYIKEKLARRRDEIVYTIKGIYIANSNSTESRQ